MVTKLSRSSDAHGDLFILDVSSSDSSDLQVASLLRRAELDQADATHFAKLQSDKRRAEWLAARVIAREELGCSISYRPNGQPYLQGSGDGHSAVLPSISISHTGTHVAMLVSSADACGVDIEHISRSAVRMASKFATQREIDLARVVYANNAEIVVWCAKEVVYKIAGVEGLDFKRDMQLLAARSDSSCDGVVHVLLNDGATNRYSEIELLLNFAICGDLVVVTGSLG